MTENTKDQDFTVDPALFDITEDEQKEIDESKANFWVCPPDRDGFVPSKLCEDPDEDKDERQQWWFRELLGIVESRWVKSSRHAGYDAVIDYVVVDPKSPNAKQSDSLWIRFDPDPDHKEKLTRAKSRFMDLVTACGKEMAKNPKSGRPSIPITLEKALKGSKFQGLFLQGYEERWDSDAKRKVPGEYEPVRKLVKFYKVKKAK